ncbi:hypothetical protein [Halorubrum sp. C191]|nr:hypothetical protein [Halorubrum sp. C191]
MEIDTTLQIPETAIERLADGEAVVLKSDIESTALPTTYRLEPRGDDT